VNTDRTLIIVPTYNERENAPALIRQAFEVLPEAHLLLVDDNSPDGTADLTEQLYGEDPRFSLMRRSGPRGLGLSYVDGYKHALSRGYDRILQMDADLSHDPRYLPDLLRAAKTADVVLGSRYCPGGGVRDWPLRRIMLSRFANRYVSLITGLPVGDATSGFRCYSRLALERIHVERIVSNGYAFQVEMTYRARQAGLSIAEVPIIFTDRRMGQSKISRAVILESMLMPWRLRFSRHIRRDFQKVKLAGMNANRRD
jgi:dolichol-phosphate mannosyltransferase